VTTVAVSTEPTVIEAGREPGRIRVVFGETFGFFGTWLRLLWRHWPALLALALAGSIVRELLLDRTFEASKWRDGLGALFVFPLVPAGLLTAMVLMLRVMRPSLPYLGTRSKPESMIVYLGSVLVPFLAFYIVAGYLQYDYARYGYSVGTQLFRGQSGANLVQDVPVAILAGVAAAAFVLRWVLNRFELVRRRPWLGLPGLYLEMLWIYPATLIAYGLQEDGTDWLEQTRAWQGIITWWHFELDPANSISPALSAGRSVINQFADAIGPVLLTPVTALVAGSVVLAARTRHRGRGAQNTSRLRRLIMVGTTAGAPVGGRFALLADGIRRVFQAGVVATMLFCLAFVALSYVNPLLNEAQRAAIGPVADVERSWKLLYFPLQYFNISVVLVLVIALIAAFVDRTAARIARRAGASTPPAGARPAPAASMTGTTAVVPEQPTTRLGPAGPLKGGVTTGRPSYDGFSPVTPTYTSEGQPAPQFGSSFGSGPGSAPPPPSGPSATPPAGLTSGLWDSKPDVAGKPVVPGDEERGRSGFGRQ
jgi:hypothetical protein